MSTDAYVREVQVAAWWAAGLATSFPSIASHPVGLAERRTGDTDSTKESQTDAQIIGPKPQADEKSAESV